jgi:orotidine-5'-phosphate decarboxylase
MTKPFASEYPKLQAKDRIITALDVATADEARALVDELMGEVRAFKIGAQLFTAAGPAFVKELVDAGARIFLDLKFHDIPNTVACAAVEAARLGVWMLNVHTLGGSRMMSEAVAKVRAACDNEGLLRPLIIGVTILTSSTETELSEIGIKNNLTSEVTRLAELAADCGLDGVVASARESNLIRKAVQRPDFLIVTPGIRPKTGTNDDQKRVTTVKQAIEAGSDFIVIGRPLLQAADKIQFIRHTIAEIEAA